VTRVGVVGLGYWGPNLARNVDRLPEADLAWLCDESAETLERCGRAFPSARTTGALEELLGDESLDAVALATPVSPHAGLAGRVLEALQRSLQESSRAAPV
jgi:predicted dehydrogenase